MEYCNEGLNYCKHYTLKKEEKRPFKSNYCNKYDEKLIETGFTNPYTMREECCTICCKKCAEDNFKYKNYEVELENIKKKQLDNNSINNGGVNMLNMNNNTFKNFGQINNDSVVLTINGEVAIKRDDDEYVKYNKVTKTIENQMNMIIKNSSSFIFILPTEEISIDDIIKVKDDYYQVVNIQSNNELEAINIKNGTKEIIIKETNIMGFNFYYKVVNIMNMKNQQGLNNMLPIIMANNSDGNINPFILQMMNNNNNSQPINPMMLMAMNNNNNGNIDMQTLLLMNMLK